MGPWALRGGAEATGVGASTCAETVRGRGWGQRVGPWPWSPPWLPARSVPRGQPLSLLALSVLVCILGPLATSSGGTVRPRETAACAVWCMEQACPESQRAYTCCRPHHCHRRLVFCPVPPCRPVEIGVGRPDPTLFHPLPELGHEVPRHPLPRCCPTAAADLGLPDAT